MYGWPKNGDNLVKFTIFLALCANSRHVFCQDIFIFCQTAGIRNPAASECSYRFYQKNELETAYEKTNFLLLDLCRVNGEILGEQYPELNQRFHRIQAVLEHEVESLFLQVWRLTRYTYLYYM